MCIVYSCIRQNLDQHAIIDAHTTKEKPMDAKEAMQALLDGKTIKHKDWTENRYLWMDHRGMIVDEDNFESPLRLKDGWEITDVFTQDKMEKKIQAASDLESKVAALEEAIMLFVLRRDRS